MVMLGNSARKYGVLPYLPRIALHIRRSNNDVEGVLCLDGMSSTRGCTAARGYTVLVQTIGGIKRKVFVSYDTVRDRPFRDFFIGQSRHTDATWYVRQWSMEYDPENGMWVSTTTGRIKEAEAVVVLLGPMTFRAPGVLKEVTIAQILGKYVYQVIPYGAGQPHVIPNVGRVVRWDWESVKRAIATAPAKWSGAKSAGAQ